MNGAFYIGATGLLAQQGAVDIVGHNIANVNTVAFKRGIADFATLVASAPSAVRATSSAPSGDPVDQGVMLVSGLRTFSQGELRETGNAMDLAIRGEGFVELQSAGGEPLLWRGGTLHVDDDGHLAVASGETLKATIAVPSDATGITIDAEGRIRATVPDRAESVELGQLELVLAADVRALRPRGEGIFEADENAALTRLKPGEERAGAMVQGFLERSNVQLSDEMVNLLIFQRAYAANARVVQAGDELMGIVNGLRR